MKTLLLDHDVVAVAVDATNNHIIVGLDDGRILSVPIDWYPRLAHATNAERKKCQLFGSGYAIEWPDIDEHISVEGLLAGRRSGECAASFERWLQTRKNPAGQSTPSQPTT